MASQEKIEKRLEEYWDWVAVVLFLLVTVDLLTSLYAASVVGLKHEANPLMKWLLTQSILVIIAIHIAAIILATVFFYGIIELIRQTRPKLRRVMMRGLEVYLGFLVAIGLFVFANNLSVLILGRSLL